MAAPAAVGFFSYSFRDAKGQTAITRVLIGDTTATTVAVDAANMKTHLQAITNAHVRLVQQESPTVVYGGTGQFQNVEDKLVLQFQGQLGAKHRYQIPAPIAAIFLADLETPDVANAALIAVLGDFTTFVYGTPTDIAPLALFLGGLRQRRKFQRRFNILTKSPLLTGPGE